MPAGVYNILIEQGATLQLPLVWRDSAQSPINLTGYTARMQLRARIADAVPLISLTTENGGITLGGVAGTIVVTITATTTAALQTKHGVYDLELVSAGGIVTRLLKGTWSMDPEVTR